MIRIRNLASGGVLDLGFEYAIEILDQQRNPAMLLLPDAISNSIKITTQHEEPEAFRQYCQAFQLQMSRVMVPKLDALRPGS